MERANHNQNADAEPGERKTPRENPKSAGGANQFHRNGVEGILICCSSHPAPGALGKQKQRPLHQQETEARSGVGPMEGPGGHCPEPGPQRRGSTPGSIADTTGEQRQDERQQAEAGCRLIFVKGSEPQPVWLSG